VRSQHLTEFYSPDILDLEYKADIAILSLSHVYHDMLTNQSASSTIYLKEYLFLLNLSQNPEQFYQNTILP
jgi:hypothetical protein